MASTEERIRRIAAVHTLLGVVFEVGGRIVDGYGRLPSEHIDALLAEFQSQIKACEIELWSWEDIGRRFFADCLDPNEGLAS